ncbi:MAG: hypothetical protein J0H68_08030 [Sphingobacteriia bacterium]|nr:hypothetical protein [Sphingobacteriia bacterium]
MTKDLTEQEEKVDIIEKKIKEMKDELRASLTTLDKILEISDKPKEDFKNLNETLKDTTHLTNSLNKNLTNLGREIRENFTKNFENILKGDLVNFKKDMSRNINDFNRKLKNDLLRNIFIGNMDKNKTEIGGIVGAIFPYDFKYSINKKLNDENSKGFYSLLKNFWGSKMFETRAIGGPVNSSTPYLVGENGPELFIPEGNGRIEPNHKLASNSSINITMNISTPDANSFRKSQSQIMSEALIALTKAKRNI